MAWQRGWKGQPGHIPEDSLSPYVYAGAGVPVDAVDVLHMASRPSVIYRWA